MSEIETLSLLFDSAWYLATYQDVAMANCDPLEHYLAFGYKEGRNPNRYFNTNFYLQNYPDLAVCPINPFVHYILYGASEGRIPRAPQQEPLPPIELTIFLQDVPLEDQLTEDPQIIATTTEAEILSPFPEKPETKTAKVATTKTKKTVRKPAPKTKSETLAQKRKKATKA